MRSPHCTKVLARVKNRYLMPNKFILPLLTHHSNSGGFHFISFHFYIGQLKLSRLRAKCVVLRGHHIHQLMFLPSVLQELSPSSS